MKIIYFILLFFITPNLNSQNNWEISEEGLGIIKLGSSLSETIVEVNKHYATKKTMVGGYLVSENGEKILIINPIYTTDIIGSIMIYSDKFQTKDGLKIGLTIKEINKNYQNFFLEYDESSGAEYYFRSNEYYSNDKVHELTNKFLFLGSNSDYIGNYKFNKQIGRRDKSYDNNENARLYFIMAELKMK